MLRRLSRRKLADYRPYTKQRLFHSLGATKRERLLRAGNQLGKCTTYETLIDTLHGKRRIGDLYEAAQPFDVWAWDGEKKVVARATAPFRKPGVHDCYRVTMADGQWIEAADNHLILTAFGWRLISGFLHEFGLSRLPSIPELAQSVRNEDALSSLEKPSDCQGGCSGGCRRYDGLLRFGRESGLVCSPSPTDVQRYTPVSCNSDDRQREHTNSLQRDSALLSSSGGLLCREDRCAASEGQGGERFAQLSRYGRQSGRLPAAASIASLRSDRPIQLPDLCGKAGDSFSAYDVVLPEEGNRIVSVEYIGRKRVYDFEVLVWHNYVAGGLVNHNTFTGAAEMAMHLTGRYPTWWDGRRFDRPVRAWAGGKDSTSVRDSLTALLLGQIGERPSGFIPPDAVLKIVTAQGVANGVDTVTVKHISGGTSTLAFKSYDQGRQRWQAATLDVVWLDEEGPEDIYLEALSRTNATGGMLYMTATPLLGMSSVVRRFLMEPSPDRSDTNMTIEDAEHISPEERAKIIASYPAHEREARTLGIPSMGSGRIFPVDENLIKVTAFPIPAHWALIGALDFGWDHPTAAARLAWDRDTDTVYVTHVYRVREAVPAVHIASLRAWGADMPWAWPHDGLQHDKGAGVQLAEQYRRGGLRMLAERAQYAGERGSSVEAGISDMLERMETERFKVFAHLGDFFEEFRLYHRKDGKVVKEFDDILSAIRYGIMSLRFARPVGGEPKRKPPVVLNAGRSSTSWMG